MARIDSLIAAEARRLLTMIDNAENERDGEALLVSENCQACTSGTRGEGDCPRHRLDYLLKAKAIGLEPGENKFRG